MNMGMLVVKGRAPEGMKAILCAEFLPVLMSSSSAAQLIMISSHEEDQSGRDVTVQTATKTCWIVGKKKLAATICKACIRCRYLLRKLQGEKMAKLPALLQVPCPP
jgi:hypothetical protein